MSKKKSNLEVISKETKQHFVTEGETIVCVTNWSNGEGIDILVQEGRATLLHGSLMWDEVSLLKLALKRADHA